LSAPRRGVIIDPTTIIPQEVFYLVWNNFPVHYQWKPRGATLVDRWIDPTPDSSASRFDPYEFSRAYDFAAYIIAGGEHTNGAKERAILGRGSASSLAREYLDLPEKCLFDLLLLQNTGKKSQLCCFIRESAGEELTEISRQTFTRLVEEDAGKVLEQKNPSGDMKLITIHCSPLLGLHLTNLAAFFEELDKVTLKSSGVDPPSQASAKQAISSSQDEHSIPSPANCTPASGHPTDAMQVNQISLGEQVRPASEY